MASSSTKKIILKSLEGDAIEVDEMFIIQCKKIKSFIDGKFINTITISLKISTEILSKIIQYVKMHDKYGAAPSKANKKRLAAWDANFMKVDMNALYDILTAASNLGHEKLLDLACKTVAGKIRGKNPEQIRQTFNIENDLTPEEEEENKRISSYFFN
ncbi:hypothetical protein TanjilG_01806 [Lupinus angustifolius]|uniref:SKP1-like protein 1A n=1 Tax=Lupinus angustifolius TaxID=3871 RepID=UPI00090E5ACB|nr:PREDICTED: SKP1-like protein 1A [Lupinus angustifolius]OIV91275.1 hypothetical protein TanjilG_01806 [Lupinus angustifolius]